MNMDYPSIFAFLFDFHHLLFLGIGLVSGYGIAQYRGAKAKLEPKVLRGQTGVIMLLAITTLIGVMGLCGDLAVVYYNYLQAQKAADSGAVAGAMYLGPWTPTTTPALATPTIESGCPADNPKGVACSYALENNAKLNELTVNSPTSSGPQTIQVTIARSVPANFLRVLGFSTIPIAVQATAIAPIPATSAKGLFPVGMSPQPGGASMVYGKTYVLTSDQTAGNWGWLDIPQGCVGAGCDSGSKTGGAQNLSTNILNGCSCEVSVNDQLSSAPGISWGQVNSSLQQIVTNPGESVPSTLTGAESQLVLIPIVQGWTGATGVTQLTILGFAEMWIQNYSKSGSNTVIQAQFVQYISSKIVGGSSGQANFGALMLPHLIS